MNQVKVTSKTPDEWFETTGAELERRFMSMLVWASNKARDNNTRLDDSQIGKIITFAQREDMQID